uniref:PGG domain-containing protein n=1 Tax=Salix viminalis TaxID=40686 RepID=A0A6N2NDC3_SALVM
MVNRLTHIISPTRPTSKTDIDGEIRNFMLVGAALIATVTFQAGITPPGGVWQDSTGNHTAGHAVYSDRGVPFLIFLIWNTIALTSSIFLLLCLTHDCPYFLEVLIAAISMMGTYSSGIYCITPGESVSFRLLFVIVTAPIVIRFLIWVVAFAARQLDLGRGVPKAVLPPRTSSSLRRATTAPLSLHGHCPPLSSTATTTLSLSMGSTPSTKVMVQTTAPAQHLESLSENCLEHFGEEKIGGGHGCCPWFHFSGPPFGENLQYIFDEEFQYQERMIEVLNPSLEKP